MAISTEVYQGDSSDTIVVSVTNDGAAVTDLTGYTGKLSIATQTGATALVDKSMTISGSTFKGQLTPSETAALSVGVYIGVVEVRKDSISFKKEYHFSFTVKKQGY
jgi:hypothetical protein